MVLLPPLRFSSHVKLPDANLMLNDWNEAQEAPNRLRSGVVLWLANIGIHGGGGAFISKSGVQQDDQLGPLSLFCGPAGAVDVLWARLAPVFPGFGIVQVLFCRLQRCT